MEMKDEIIKCSRIYYYLISKWCKVIPLTLDITTNNGSKLPALLVLHGRGELEYIFFMYNPRREAQIKKVTHFPRFFAVDFPLFPSWICFTTQTKLSNHLHVLPLPGCFHRQWK